MIDDVQAFLEAWRIAAPHEVTAKPDAAIRLALLRLGLGVARRVAHGKKDEDAIRPFQAAVAKRDAFTTDSSSLGAWSFLDGDRMLIDVRMGSASAVFAFDRTGKSLSLPPKVAWSPGYEGRFGRAGRLLYFDGSSIMDMGTRYAYRLHFLRRTKQGYVSAGLAKGLSTYDYDSDVSPRLTVTSTRVIVKALEEPHAFSVSNAESVLKRTETWDVSGPVAKLRSTLLGDRDLRAVDAWLVAHRGARLAGGRKVPIGLVIAENIRRGKSWIELGLQHSPLHFDLGQRRGQTFVRHVRPL